MTKTKTRLLSLALAIVMAVGILAASIIRCPNGVFASRTRFLDVPTTFWAYDAIERAATDGAVNGVGNNRFNPSGTLTVAQWMVIVTRAFCGDRVNASTANGAWYAKNEDVANQLGLLNGVGNTDMSTPINRYDMAQLVYNVLNMAGCKVMAETGEYSIDSMAGRVGDWDSVPEKYRVAVGTVFDNGIIMGIDDRATFNGYGTFNRAQAAAVYTRMADFMVQAAGKQFPSKLAPVESNPPAKEEPVTPPAPVEPEIPTAPTEGTASGDTTFAMKNGENVQQMMDRINAATPAYQEGYLTNGKAITSDNIAEMLAEIKVSMPEGTPWATGQTYHYFSPKFRGGGGCNAFAYAVSDAIFGEDAPLTEHQNFASIKIGDVIWEKNVSGSIGHVSVVISNPDENGYFDLASGNLSKKVSWDDEGNIRIANNADFNKTSYVYSRY